MGLCVFCYLLLCKTECAVNTSICYFPLLSFKPTSNGSEQMALKSSCYYANLSSYSPKMCLANHYLKGQQMAAQFNAYKLRYAPPECMEAILCPSLNTIADCIVQTFSESLFDFPIHLI